MPDIILIQPPIRDFYHTPHRTQPLGLQYLAAALNASGLTADIIDCHHHRSQKIEWPKAFSYLAAHYRYDRGPFRMFHQYRQFGSMPKEWPDALAFGISANFSAYINEAIKIAEKLKAEKPQRITIFGGAHATAAAEELIDHPAVDIIILGEGETVLPEVVNAIKEKRLARLTQPGVYIEMPGLSIRNTGIIRTADLNAIPDPLRIKSETHRYRHYGKPYAAIITSRGCPHGCRFCVIHIVAGRQYRARSPESVLEEMSRCRREGIMCFHIEDDNFTFDRERAMAILRGITRRFGENQIDLVFPNGLSYADLDGELIQWLSKSGVRNLPLAMATGSADLRKDWRRPDGNLERAIQDGLAAKMTVALYLFLGMPGQSVSEMAESIA